MKRLFIPLGLIALMVLPATAVAAPTKADKREGKQECRSLLRTVETRANFVQVVKLEAKANSRNAFGRCVKVRAADATGERRAAFRAAKRACAALRRAPGAGGRPSAPGAYGKCVSAAARTKLRASDAGQRAAALNPARTCRSRQKADLNAFEAAFPGRNGFGTCVARQARAQSDDAEAPDDDETEAPETDDGETPEDGEDIDA